VSQHFEELVGDAVRQALAEAESQERKCSTLIRRGALCGR
jgi:hypothetical protein